MIGSHCSEWAVIISQILGSGVISCSEFYALLVSAAGIKHSCCDIVTVVLDFFLVLIVCGFPGISYTELIL